jgi:hypothetical protein
MGSTSVRKENAGAITDLRKALELNAQRLQTNSSARDLSIQVGKDQMFNSLKNDDAFKKIFQKATTVPTGANPKPDL